MRLAGRVALITGAASGLGLATAHRFHAEGASVVLADIDREGAERAAAGLGADRVAAIGCDITSAEQCVRAVELAETRFGRLDVVHANAGVPFNGPIEEVDRATLDRVVDVNLKGPFLTAQAAVPTLKRQRSGCIIFTSSLQAVLARPHFTPYTAAKHGVIGLMKGLALELAPYGIRVNAIAPAATPTPMLPRFLGGMAELPEEALERFRASIPLGRLATPEDTAAAALYLASDDAAMVTGHTLVMDGGTSAG